LSRAELKAIAEQGRDSSTVAIPPIHLDISADKPPQEATNDEITRSDAFPDGKIHLKEATDRFQQCLIASRLNKHNGNRAAVARELGLDRGNFYRLLKRLDL